MWEAAWPDIFIRCNVLCLRSWNISRHCRSFHAAAWAALSADLHAHEHAIWQQHPAGKHARWLATVMEASPSTHFRIPCRRSSPRRTIFLSPILSFSGRRLAASMESKDPARSAILRARFSWLRPRGLRPSIPLPACGSSHRNLLHEAVVLPERAGAAPRAREHSKRGLTRLSIAPKRASDSLAWPRPVTPSRSL
jgi:hypothetical protein